MFFFVAYLLLLFLLLSYAQASETLLGFDYCVPLVHILFFLNICTLWPLWPCDVLCGISIIWDKYPLFCQLLLVLANYLFILKVYPIFLPDLLVSVWRISFAIDVHYVILLFSTQGVDFNSSLKFSFDLSLPGKKTSRKTPSSRKVKILHEIWVSFIHGKN